MYRLPAHENYNARSLYTVYQVTILDYVNKEKHHIANCFKKTQIIWCLWARAWQSCEPGLAAEWHCDLGQCSYHSTSQFSHLQIHPFKKYFIQR